MNINTKIHNCFDIVVRDSGSGEVKQTGRAENIILNAFWPKFCSASNNTTLNYIQFGSGTAAPTAADTALTTFIAGKICATDVIDTSEYVSNGLIKRKRSIRIEAGEQTGQTISEVGFASAATTGLVTKAIVKDSNGNPLSIVVGASDVVDIYATFYAKVPLTTANLTGNEGIQANSSGLFSFLICKGWSISDSGYCAGYALPFSFNPDTRAEERHAMTPSLSYDAASKKVSLNFADLTAGTGNIPTGIASLYSNGLCVKLPCTGFTQPVIIKEVVGTGDGVKKDFASKFGRILDNGTARLYVDDVEVPATFDYGIPNYPASANNNCKILMRIISMSGTEVIWENPYYEKYGLAEMYFAASYSTLYVSNDGTSWTAIASNVGSATIASGNQKYRYWRLTNSTNANVTTIRGDSNFINNAKVAIHASSAPASGATVALTYQPNCIAKDDQHILKNVKVEVTFNEYTP